MLWRYVDLAELVSLLSDGKIPLTRADVFQDRHEGSITSCMMETAKLQFADRAKLARQISDFGKLMKESVFVSCWCMEPESEAMWKLYCGDDHGIAITAVYGDLEASVINRGLVMAPVRYLDYQIEGFPRDNLLYPFFHKRAAFAHEREVRIVKWCSEHLPGKRARDHKPTPEDEKSDQEELKRGLELKAQRGTSIQLQFDVDTLIRDIVVHPYAPEWYFRTVKLVVGKFTPNLVNRVKWSSMRAEPLY